MTKLRPEGLEFLTTAPKRWEYEEPVAAPQAVVFDAISADPTTWTWFPGLSAGGYEGDGPRGVGSRRFVRMSRVTYRETIVAWDAPSRWAYRVDECTVPMAKALVEDWHVEPASDGATSVVRWTFAIDPGPLFRAGMPLAPTVMGRLFHRAMSQLGATLQAKAS
jgi:hypothetical protein